MSDGLTRSFEARILCGMPDSAPDRLELETEPIQIRARLATIGAEVDREFALSAMISRIGAPDDPR